MLDDAGHMTATDVQRDLDVDVALRWGIGYETVAAVVREHHRDAQGRHACGRASNARWSRS